MCHDNQMLQRRIHRRFSRRPAHLQDPARYASRLSRRSFRQNRNCSSLENMRCPHPRARRRTQNTREISTRSGRFRSWLHDVEDRPGTATLTGTDDFEIHTFDRFVFQNQPTQFVLIDHELSPVQLCVSSKAHFRNSVMCESKLHSSILSRGHAILKAGRRLLSTLAREEIGAILRLRSEHYIRREQSLPRKREPRNRTMREIIIESASHFVLLCLKISASAKMFSQALVVLSKHNYQWR